MAGGGADEGGFKFRFARLYGTVASVLFFLLAVYVFYEQRTRPSALPPGTYGSDTCPVVSLTLLERGNMIAAVATKCATDSLYTCGDLAGSNHTCPQLRPFGQGAGCVETGLARVCFDAEGRRENSTASTSPALFPGLTSSSTLVLSGNGTTFELPNITVPETLGGPGVFFHITKDAQGRVVLGANETVLGLTYTTVFGGAGGDVTGSNATLFLRSRGFGNNFTIGAPGCSLIMGLADGGVVTSVSQTCTAVTTFANNTILQGTACGITIADLGNNTFTFNTAQPLCVTAAPTFAGLTINNFLHFNGVAGLNPPAYSGPVAGAMTFTGTAVVQDLAFGALNTVLTPAALWYTNNDAYPHMGGQCRNQDDCGFYWDMYPTAATVLVPSPHAEFVWAGTSVGVTGYALWKSSNALVILSGSAPGSQGATVSTSTLAAFGTAEADIFTDLRVFQNAFVSGNTQIQGVLTLPTTPLYVSSGGTGSGTTVGASGHRMMISKAGTNGGQIVESTTGSLRYDATFTVSCGTFSRVITFYLVRQGDLISLRVLSGFGFANNNVAACFFSGVITGIPSGLDISQSHCTQTRGTINLLDGTISACMTANGPTQILVEIFMGDWGDFLIGSNYILPSSLDFATIADTPFV